MATFTTRLVRGTVLTVAAGVLALAAAGCSLATGTGDPTASGSPEPSGTLGKAPAGKPAGKPKSTPSPTATPTTEDHNGGWNDNTGGHNTTTTQPPAPTGPSVVYFKVKQKPQCPQGTNVFQTPAVPLVVEWKVRDAHQVVLSVDGPGAYKTYDGTTGSETFTFSCGGAPNSIETHTYTIKAGHASKTLSVSAKVYEIAQV
jgi:hypothetical protein